MDSRAGNLTDSRAGDLTPGGMIPPRVTSALRDAEPRAAGRVTPALHHAGHVLPAA